MVIEIHVKKHELEDIQHFKKYIAWIKNCLGEVFLGWLEIQDEYVQEFQHQLLLELYLELQLT